MEFLNDYIVVAVLVACLCVGYVIKHCIPTEKINKYIPLIVAVLGVVINTWINEWAFTPEILIGGIVSGLASTGLHQIFKQFIEKNTLAVPVENKTE
jgi:ABC-type sugar transport system permease subunit